MPDIFLSYSRKDLATAGKLAGALQAAGHDVWWDQALKSGEVYDQVTEAALREARVVVVLWSKAAVASDWVRSEATVAMQRGALMPVMIEDCQRPVMFELRQSADLIGWKGNAKDPRLVAFLGDVARQLATPPTGTSAKAAAVAATASPSAPNRRLLIGGAAGVAALAASGFGAWKFMAGKSDDGTASVVVLPFANLSGDPEQAFFSDGIAEELRNALSQIRGLKVIGRVSSERFRDTDDLAAAAQKLGVDHVLTGSVRRSPTTIRIAAQLVDGRTGVESWSASYDQPAGDVLAIQSKIATNVVSALSARLAKTAGVIQVGVSANPQVQELLLRAGKAFYNAYDVTGLQEAQRFLEAAIAIDPDCAAAWAGVAYTRSNIADFVVSETERRALLRAALAASQRAVALAPNSGFSHQALAGQYMRMLDMRRAFAENERATALAPAEPGVILGYSALLLLFDPDRAVAAIRDAQPLDPLNPYYYFTFAKALVAARQYDAAAHASRRDYALGNNPGVSNLLIVALLGAGQIAAARAELAGLARETVRLAYTAMVEARAGQRAASDAALSQMRGKRYSSINSLLAQVHAQRGETAAALDALERAYQAKELDVTLIAVDPLLDPLRREPRFKALQDAVIPPDLFVPPKRR